MHQFGKSIVVFSALFYSLLASAADNNWVVGGGLGQSVFKLNAPAGYSVSGASETAKSTAYDFFIGYKINSFVAVEAGYLNLGKYMISGSRGNASAQASTKVSGVTLVDVWKYSLNDQWSFFARTGLIAGTAKTSVTVNNPPNAVTSNQDNNSGVLPVRGLGIGYALNKEWEVRGQYQNIGATKVAEGAGSQVKFHDDLWSVS